MDTQEYVKVTRELAKYPEAKDPTSVPSLMYLGLGLGGEAGEVQDHIKKIFGRGLENPQDYPNLAKIRDEMGDVAWFYFRILDYFGWKLEDVLDENVGKLTGRINDGTLLQGR